jgi:hypothetical protein
MEGANKAQIARSIEMVIVESNFGIKSFLSSFDRKIISKNRNKYKPQHIN